MMMMTTATTTTTAAAGHSLASGAHPFSTFPNYLAKRGNTGMNEASWSAPRQGSPLEELRQAVRDQDWDRLYEEGRTRICMRAEWSASGERCALLRMLASTSGARRVLEIGSFCGAGALALSEALPDGGEVRALELDDFSVELGRGFQARSPAGGRIRTTVGKAEDSLRDLARGVRLGREGPFDLVVVDADKEGMRQYFDLLWGTPGFLSEDAVVCVDTTPFKGQVPVRYVKFGFPYRWEGASGQDQIDALRTALEEDPTFTTYEFGGLLIVRRASKA